MTIMVYGIALGDNLSSYFLSSTHSNRVYFRRKLMRRMEMGGIWGAKWLVVWPPYKNCKRNRCVFASGWL